MKHIQKTVPIDKIRASPNPKETGTKGWTLYVTKTDDGYYLADNQDYVLEAMKQLGWKEVLCYVYIG